MRSRGNLLSYARLRCKAEFEGHQAVGHKEVLFEIQGYPHFLDGDNECKCFFAMARPYPSRNTAVYVFQLALVAYSHLTPVD